MRVEIDIFSGRRNPQWSLSTEQSTAFLNLLRDLPKKPADDRRYDGLGYRGFRLSPERENENAGEIVVYHDLVMVRRGVRCEAWEDERHVLESWLLAASTGHVPEPVLARVINKCTCTEAIAMKRTPDSLRRIGIMVTYAFGGLDFTGILKVELVCPPDRIDVLPGPGQKPNWPFLYRFGTTQPPQERLKIDAPQMWFDCQVRATGVVNVHEWGAGILQSISHGSWIAHYSNGADLRYRLNTEDGLIKDARAADCLFIGEGCLLNATASPNVYECSLLNRDAPSVTFVTEFSGNPFHAHEPIGDGLEQLTRTEGKVNFHSFLAVVNKTTGAILTLGECQWSLTWGGAYDFANKTWTPNDPNSIITYTESDIAKMYENPKDPDVRLPFKLDGEVANNRREILTNEGWKPCREGLPDLGDGQRTGR
ncbi:MAG TPA: hypothetical protein VMG10_22340 [Gemmataceae bacterium]|nr:hypothetical protein [Gemmataceae bacterium]